MLRPLSLVLVATFASSVLATAQVMPSPTDPATQQRTANPAVAYLYVSNNPSGSNTQINALAVDSNGALSRVPGSPFSTTATTMAVNGKYLFATNGVDIDSFSIAANGALTQVSSINAQQFNQGNCGGPSDLFLDRTGATLYDLDFDGNICANNPYQSFKIDNSDGVLTYLGATSSASPVFESALSFIGNNLYGYSSSCYHFESLIFGFVRNSDGTLTDLNITPPIPAGPPGDTYCPYLAAADPTNHVAIPLTPVSETANPSGPTQLAVYSADASGNLTTNSTAANMPQTAVSGAVNSGVDGPNDLRISPSGKFLAVAGVSGLQVFHFNGSHPISSFTGLLIRQQVDHVFWDNSDHLYAISSSAGKLFVFTVTSTSVSPAPGSPHSIVSPADIVVLSR